MVIDHSEWCEWFTYQQWLSEGVDLRQILVETHNAPMPNAKNFFYDLHDHGYVMICPNATFVWGSDAALTSSSS